MKREELKKLSIDQLKALDTLIETYNVDKEVAFNHVKMFEGHRFNYIVERFLDIDVCKKIIEKLADKE